MYFISLIFFSSSNMTCFLVFDILQFFVKLLVMLKYDSLLGRICEKLLARGKVSFKENIM